MDFLNMWSWQPNGHFSAKDEAALAGTEAGAPFWPSAAYAEFAAANGLDVGDEVFGGDAYAWVEPAAVDMRKGLRTQFASAVSQATEHEPTTSHGPGVAELANALYQGVAGLWQSLAANYSSDWSQS